MRTKFMKHWQLVVTLGAVVALTPLACSKTPNTPSVSFTSPLASQPANGATYKFRDQPVTLTITNATRTGSAVPTYSIEVASDSGFANKVFTRDGIAEGSGNTTTVTIANLSGGLTYYWHSKTTIDGITGPASPMQAFVIQPQIIINPPTVDSPTAGVTVSSNRPSFTVVNATRIGPVGTIFYEFQLSNSASFSTIVASATVQEQQTRTTWTVASDVPDGTYFWRARATDPANGEASGFPGGTTFSLQSFDMKKAVIHNNPGNLGSWAETSKITMADTSGEFVVVDFDKREGPGAWRAVSFGAGEIQYTLGMCFNLGGTWHCSAVIQFWPGRELEAGGRTNEIGINWYYDGRWVPMSGHQPANGEIIGIFAANGNIRDSDNWSIEQRTNVVLMPFGSKYVAK